MEGPNAGAAPGARPLPSGVVTFLLSDIAGSTRLWEADEEVAAAAIRRHYELLDTAIVLHGGVRPEEQGEGDSVVGVFTRPSDALAAALDVQLAFASEPWPEQARLGVRIALHTGEARLRDAGSYFGPGIIRCARLRAIANAGQVLVSSATRDLVADRLPDEVTLRDLGLHRLKDLGRPERVSQLCHPDLVNEFPPLRSLSAAPNNLPVQLTSLVGREKELAGLHTALEDNRLLTLTGAGGCGKTRLAVHAVAEMVDRHPDGVWWVELGPVSDPDLVPYVVARAFGLREEEGRPVIETLAEQLTGIDALLALDNCEHLVGACAGLVERLLRAAPGLRVVATSREALGVPGEATWPVPSLDDEAATELFVERAAHVRPGFSPDADETVLVTQICRRLDGIPLAIELAAARTRMMSPARIADALGDRFRLLTGGGRTALPRQQTLETSVAWSHELLDAEERALLRRLSVFAGGFTLDAAEAVGAADPLDRYAVLDVLSRLVDKSLVHVDHDAEGRYRLLETIRLYAGQRLVESGESDVTRNRHLAFFLSFAERAEPEIVRADGEVWLAQLERDHDNLRAAMEWADSTAASEAFLRLTVALALFFELHSHLVAGGRWFARALGRDEEPSVVRARALWGAAHVAMYGGDFATLDRRAPEALAMAEQVGDGWALGRALNTNGLVQAFSKPEPARRVLERSIELGRRAGDDWAVVDGWKMVNLTWMLQDDYDALAPALAEFRSVSEELGSKFFIAWYHTTIGWIGTFQGDFARARQALDLASQYDAELGGAATAGFATAFVGAIESLTGAYDEALTRLERFLERAAATGNALGRECALPFLAQLHIGLGRPLEAVALLEPWIEPFRSLGMAWFLSWDLSVLGRALLASGDVPGAQAAIEEAKAVAQSIPNLRLVGLANHELGQIARLRGDSVRAEDLYHQALSQRVERQLLPDIAESLEALGGLACDQESYREGARLLGAATALRRAMAFARWPADEPGHEANVARARQGLGEEAFETTWAEGEALAVDDAVAYASRARGERKRPSVGWASLTPTELEVVKLAAKGLTNPEIGERLFIGRATVKTHLAHVFAKLGLATRAELAAEATRHGL